MPSVALTRYPVSTLTPAPAVPALERSLNIMKLLVITAILAGHLATAFGEEQKRPEDLIVDYVAATGDSSFSKVVDSVHPSVLKSFKTHTLNIVQAAVTESSEEAVMTAFQGLGSLNDLATFSDRDFWVYVMSNLYSHRPEFDGAKSVEYVGKVEDGDFLYVLYTLNGDLKSTDPIERIRSPRTFTFRRSGERWCYWSFEISAVEKYIQLSAKRFQLMASLAKSEQDGTGQPATRPELEPQGSDKPQPEAEGRSR